MNQKLRRWMNATKIVEGSYQTPMPICSKAYRKFEKMNNVSLFIWQYSEENGIMKVFASEKDMATHTPVDLLVIEKKEKDKETERHYIAVKKYNTLLCSLNKKKTSKFVCRYCETNFQSEEKLTEHRLVCGRVQNYKMPTVGENDIMRFSNNQNKVPVPFIIYGDFESRLVDIIEEEETEELIVDEKKEVQVVKKRRIPVQKRNTIHNQKHLPYSYGLKAICTVDPNIKFDLVMGYHIDQFWGDLDKIKDKIHRIIDDVKPMNLTNEEQKSFRNATDCWICEKELGTKTKKALDVNWAGELNGYCHYSCRSAEAGNYKMTKEEKDKYYEATQCSRCNKNFEIKQGKLVGKCIGMNDKFEGVVCMSCRTPQEGNYKLTPEDRIKLKEQNDCVVCNKPFVGVRDAVRDHCHISGIYRGAAHNECNLNLRQTKKMKIPVVFHNLRGYDSHLIVKAFNESGDEKGRNISCIPNNSEKYMSISVSQFKFIDSAQFLLGSLDSLVESMKRGNRDEKGSIIEDQQTDDTFADFYYMNDWIKNGHPGQLINAPDDSLLTKKLIISK